MVLISSFIQRAWGYLFLAHSHKLIENYFRPNPTDHKNFLCNPTSPQWVSSRCHDMQLKFKKKYFQQARDSNRSELHASIIYSLQCLPICTKIAFIRTLCFLSLSFLCLPSLTATGNKTELRLGPHSSAREDQRQSSISPKMGRCIILSSSTLKPSRFSRKPTSIFPFGRPRFSFPRSLPASSQPLKCRFCGTLPSTFSCRRAFSTNAVLSESPNQKHYLKVGAESTGPIPSDQLLDVIETAATTGAQVPPWILF